MMFLIDQNSKNNFVKNSIEVFVILRGEINDLELGIRKIMSKVRHYSELTGLEIDP